MAKNKYLLRHISIRVPWHDSGWNGTVCKAPKFNGACLKLSRISDQRDEEAEEAVAGKSIQELDESQWPCCVPERAMFMAPFEYVRHAEHPYKAISAKTHGHFAPTPLRHPSYSAPAIPFRWMFTESMAEFRDEYQIDVDSEREPDLGFDPTWVQDLGNQKALLDCFFEHIRPEESLCFFYAKQIPFVEEAGRVIVGVGRVLHVGDGIEYEYESDGDLRSMLWERMVQHSIRPYFKDGFILPYQAAIDYANENPGFDPRPVAALAPEDRWDEFSFTSEHVTHDGAISALLSCARSLEQAKKHLPGPWDACLKWINDRLGDLWRMRGPCPGLGSALCAFGVEYGTFVAREIAAKLEDNEDPWPVVQKVFEGPKDVLSKEAAAQIGKTIQQKWQQLPKERLALLKLLSCFEINPQQAKTLYVQEERQEARIVCTDREILENPYRIFEVTRHTVGPVSIWAVDRGVFPDTVIREKHPLPEPTNVDTGTDGRRVRAWSVQSLEQGASAGHSLMTRTDVIMRIRGLEVQPACEVDGDLMDVVQGGFEPEITLAKTKDGSTAYQLSRLAQMGEIIRRAVKKRIAGKRLSVSADWRCLVDEALGEMGDEGRDREEIARTEKAAALQELAESRISVLIGPAGTGKTTLLSILCQHEDIAAGGVLLLAPTGKARVRMEEAAKRLGIQGYTIAQFLSRHDRYDAETARYQLSDEKVEHIAKTVVIDEASMLTEEMLAALIDALSGVHRLVLVGDPRQLPPIGTGRPFVDIVAELSPDDISAPLTRVGQGYAELTIQRRQAGEAREDLQLAQWFSGVPVAPGEDEVLDRVISSGSSEHVKFVPWQTPEEFQDILISVVLEELRGMGVEGDSDQELFDRSLGCTEVKGYRYFNCGAAKSSESWQILSPVRGFAHGVGQINRLIHGRFRSDLMKLATGRYRRVTKPMGAEQIIYGDKVINVRNHARHKVYPKDDALAYVANGEIGIATGQFRSKKIKKPWLLKVEFSSQQGFQYDYSARDFNEEGDSPLELAYALTIHKAQGSEFGVVILVLPDPCWLLSRELLYTALTRQKQRIVVLHQGDRWELKKYASDRWSDTKKRLTNLFCDPDPVDVGGMFFEDRLINRTRRGELVRSKSEVIIADRMADLDIDYVYEQPLVIKDVRKFPDFTIEDAETGQTFYWEHCGMLSDPDYRERWEAKLQWYKDNGILPCEDGGGDTGSLIVTVDNERGGISSQEIEAVIRQHILT